MSWSRTLVRRTLADRVDLIAVLFYILTDADSQRDHVLGFFSKEKITYDDYNLACIVVLPPYQRMRYGMLMIEFSKSHSVCYHRKPLTVRRRLRAFKTSRKGRDTRAASIGSGPTELSGVLGVDVDEVLPVRDRDGLRP